MSNSALSATLQQSDNWRKWRNYSALGLGIILTLAPLPSTVTVYVLGITAFLFLALGIRRPAFIVAALIMVELTIAKYPPRFAGLPMNTSYVMTFGGAAITLFLAPLMSQRLTLGPGWRRVVIPGAIFIILSAISTSQGFTPELTFQAARYYVAAFAVMLLTASLIRTRSDLKLVGTIGIAVLVISAVMAIMQHFGWLPATAIYRNGLEQGRAMGLTSSAIQSSGHFMLGVALLWGLVTQLTLEKPTGRFILLLTLLVGFGLYFTFTRTAVLGVVVGGGLFMTLFLRGRVRKEIILAALLLAPVAGFLLLKANTRYTEESSSEDVAANARSVLWAVGAEIAMDYPLLGIGYDAFNEVAPQYLGSVTFSDAVADKNIVNVVERSPVHNDYLRIWLSFGLPALIMYVLLMIGIAANSLQAYFRAKDPWLRGAGIGCFGAIVAYATNSAAHNSFDSTLALWILAGLSLVLLRLSSQSQES